MAAAIASGLFIMIEKRSSISASKLLIRGLQVLIIEVEAGRSRTRRSRMSVAGLRMFHEVKSRWLAW